MIGPEFTTLEKAILGAICDAEPENCASLKLLFSDAKIIKRENTGHGFYTNFSVRNDSPTLALSSPLTGPIAYMLDMGPGMMMGFLLWFANGYPSCLEGFQYTDEHGETVDLRERDLASLQFSRLDWSPGKDLH